MFNILPFILIVLSLVVIIFVIVRKYPQLLLLDVDTLPEMKIARNKNKLIMRKSEQREKQYYANFKNRLTPFVKLLKKIQLAFRILVGKIEKKVGENDRIANGPSILKQEKKEQFLTSKDLVKEAQIDLLQEDYPTAEKKFLASLKYDPKNKEAYHGLAAVYYAQNQVTEAKETYNFLLQLDPNDENTNVKLGEIYEEEGDKEKAVEYYQQAVLTNPDNPERFLKIYELLFYLKHYETALEAIKQALEIAPQNPHYVDNFIETSIILKHKDLAEEGYKQLRMINPDNQKLEVFKQRIDEIKE
ncbi:MAG: tetratricopeptide repeat protein [Candidatus Magasanikbacteria bacterium]